MTVTARQGEEKPGESFTFDPVENVALWPILILLHQLQTVKTLADILDSGRLKKQLQVITITADTCILSRHM